MAALTLTIVGFLSAFLLSLVNESTKSYILEAENKNKMDSLSAIFPFKIEKIETINENEKTFYEIKNKNNELTGLAIESMTLRGYGGKINVLLAVSPNCEIFSYRVLSHLETPGLGDKITHGSFINQFKGKKLKDHIFKIKKEGGFVDGLTAATVSSKAITEAISSGLKKLKTKYPERCN